MMSLNQKLSLAIYFPYMASGGAERQTLNLIPLFVEYGIEVTLVLDRAEGALLKDIPTNVRVFVLGAGRTILALPKLIRYLRLERPAVLISNIDHNNIVALLARRLSRARTKIVICQHTNFTNHVQSMVRSQDRIFPWLARVFYRQADAIVAVSNGVAADLSAALSMDPQTLDVIQNPVVTDDLDRRAAEGLKHPWFSKGAPPVFVAAGRLIPQKQFAMLLHAFRQLLGRADARLIILGEGPLLADLGQRARDLGIAEKVDFVGFVSNPMPYFKRAAALVMTSSYEGFGNVLVEAMACGTPVISTNCPSGPREILENGRFGALVPVGDENALASAMLASLEQPTDPQRLREATRRFHARTISLLYLRLFKRVVTGR